MKKFQKFEFIRVHRVEPQVFEVMEVRFITSNLWCPLMTSVMSLSKLECLGDNLGGFPAETSVTQQMMQRPLILDGNHKERKQNNIIFLSALQLNIFYKFRRYFLSSFHVEG